MHYFPEPDTPALQPLTQAFVHLMFAHAEFDRRVLDLIGVITCNSEFGQQHRNQWSAKDRPKMMRKLIKEHLGEHAGGIPEINEIVACMQRAISPSDDHHVLAHGHWWAFNIEAGSITVRAAKPGPIEELHRDFTVAKIRETAELFEQLEVELFFLQRHIEQRDASAQENPGLEESTD
jgi:hypothetical protein